VLVVDSYRLAGEELAAVANGRRIVLLHDALEPPAGAALVVSVAADAGEGRLAGTRYAALRPGFWGLPRRTVRVSVGQILVTTGSSSFGNLARELAETVTAAAPDAGVTLVLGPQATVEAPPAITALNAPDSLLEPLIDADLVVTAGGQTMLEAAATGAPCIVVPVVDNQRRQVERLATCGAVRVVERVGSDLGAAVDELAHDAEARQELSQNAQQAVDGYGALRVAFEIGRLVETGS
jgi:spore coat polysaccharide biosynthesis predicted glycosyltransferase SpsG